MIDYLKIENELEPFGWKEWKEFKEEYAEFESEIAFYYIVFHLFSFIAITLWLTWMCFFDKNIKPDALPNLSIIMAKILLYHVFCFVVFLITIIFLPKWKFKNKRKRIHIEYDNFETEENLKKVSYYGIENVNNFRNNIKILEEKTKYMVFENCQEKEKYINKLLNIFYKKKKKKKKMKKKKF